MQENNSPKRTFAERLETAIQRAGFRASDLARAAGVSKGYVSELLRGGKSEPSARVAHRFAEVLHCDLLWLLSGNPRRIQAPEGVDLEPEEISSRIKEDPYPPPQCDPMARIAAALERIAAAMEVANREPINYRRKENEP